LAETIRYVVSQRLVSKIGGGRLLVTEVMGSSLRTREVIAYGESENKTFHEIIEAGTILGWHSFDQKLVAAFENEQITEETAMLFRPSFRFAANFAAVTFIVLSGTISAAPSPSPAVSATPAPQVDPKLFSGMRWRQVGPFRGGRALAIEGVLGEPNTWYFGAV